MGTIPLSPVAKEEHRGDFKFYPHPPISKDISQEIKRITQGTERAGPTRPVSADIHGEDCPSHPAAATLRKAHEEVQGSVSFSAVCARAQRAPEPRRGELGRADRLGR